MNVDKAMEPFVLTEGTEEPEIEVAVINPEAVVVETEDGGVEITFGEEPGEVDEEVTHNSNLAEFLDEKDLDRIASELVDAFEADRRSRKEWVEAYIHGLELLGMKIEERTEPWDGASGVFHPMLSEAVVRFQAQAMGELMPSAGPAKTRIKGKITREKFERAQRIEQELNYQITERIPNYRPEMEQLLFKLPLAGSAFKK